MEILVQAINVGHDPAELYALMMERSVAGDDLHPYISLMGQLRETFDSIHVKAEWGEGFHKGVRPAPTSVPRCIPQPQPQLRASDMQ